VLELRDVVKHHHVGAAEPIRAVDGVSMVAAAGEFIALYGPSGSGKTTLLEVIAALQRPDRGSVLLHGKDIFSLSPKEQNELRLWQLGFIGSPQSLIPGARAIENAALKLLLVSARDAKASVEPLLEQLGLSARLQHRTDQLSMGERQRVVIARALATEPRLVLADEPTGSLDTQQTREVLGLLRTFCTKRGMTTLLATHDPEAAAFADTIFELRDGRLTDYTAERLRIPPASAQAHSQ
jgi:putative ABC transport system ATP-binding protein